MALLPNGLPATGELPPKKETKNQIARRLGIPKSLRQYHARYGNGGGPEAIATVQAQFDVPKIDHARDRAIAKQVREESELEEAAEAAHYQPQPQEQT